MTNLVSPPSGSDLTNAQIAAAEALVAARLDMPSLKQVEQAESGSVGSSGLIHLKLPATTIHALTLSGAPAAGVLRSPRVLDVRALVSRSWGSPWGSGIPETPYTVRYLGGWTADNLPEQIRQAVLATATYSAATEGAAGIKAESLGPRSVTYQDTFSGGTLPADAVNLLMPWLPLRF